MENVCFEVAAVRRYCKPDFNLKFGFVCWASSALN